MCVVNYIKESEAFIVDSADRGLASNAFSLWFAIFHIVNRRSNGTVWPDGLVAISNRSVLSLVTFSEDTLKTARKQLIDKGFIRYKKGMKKEAHPKYELILADERRGYYLNDDEENGFYPQNTGKTYGITGGKTDGITVGKTDGITGDQYINYNKTRNITPCISDDEDDEDELYGVVKGVSDSPHCLKNYDTYTDITLANNPVNMLVERAFLNAFGRKPNMSETCSLAANFRNAGALEIMSEMFLDAAMHGPRDSVAYIGTMLASAVTHGAVTPTAYHRMKHLQSIVHNHEYAAMIEADPNEAVQELLKMGEGGST